MKQINLFNENFSISNAPELTFSDVTSKHLETNKKYKVLSLFCGCGGMDLGFIGNFNFLNKYYEENPFEIIYANDIKKQACDTYSYNFKHDAVCQDIKEIKLESLPNNVDIVIGGFPCQDFSLAGKRLGLSAERGRLYLEMKKIIDYCNPLAFVAENVDGIRKSVQGCDTSALDTILKDFEASGYYTYYQPLNASNYGVPQNRVRVIIFGIRKDICKKVIYPLPLYGEEKQFKLVTAKEAIDDLWDCIDTTEIPNHTNKDYSKAKFYLGKKTQGNCRISADRPAPTIRSEHHGNIEGHYRTNNLTDETDVNSWRRLSVRECARLQSFPDNFVFPCASSEAYKQIGNAVPPVFAWHIARALYESLN